MSPAGRADDGPRVCMVSRRAFEAHPSRCCGYEFEDAIASLDTVETFAPASSSRSTFVDRVLAYGSRRSRFDVSRKPILPRLTLTRSYDVFFFHAQSLDDLSLLRTVNNWRERCGVAVCWLEELWDAWIEAHWDRCKDEKDIAAFDHVILNCSGSVARLAAKTGRACHYIPAGVDAELFCPYPTAPPRDIDVYYMGRRSPVTHQALLTLSDEGRIFYLFDTLSAGRMLDPHQHRRQMANLIGRSRYFIANKAKFNMPQHTKGQQELGQRFFEGAAAGAVLLSDPPRNEVFGTYFDWPDAVIVVPMDCENIGDVLADLDGQPERLAAIRQQNVVQSLRRHDWVHRWAAVLEILGLPPTEAMARRRERLEALATAVEGESIEEAAQTRVTGS